MINEDYGRNSSCRQNRAKITTISTDPIRIRIQTEGNYDPMEGIRFRIDIRDMEGTCVASGEGEDMELEIPEGRVWSAEAPVLYRCIVSVVKENDLLDQIVETFGIRKLICGKEGFFINGEKTLLRGACILSRDEVSEEGTVGTAEERRVRILKKNGFNAIRIEGASAPAHLLDACDLVGLYVMQEVADDSEQMDAVMTESMNHPSVILYSVGQRYPESIEAEEVERVLHVIRRIRSVDDTRPICGGIVREMDPEMSEHRVRAAWRAMGAMLHKKKTSESVICERMLNELDIVGYEPVHGKLLPKGKEQDPWVRVGTGTLPEDVGKCWERVKKYPFLIGDFMIVDNKAIDRIGYAGAEAHYAAAVWNQSEHPYIGVWPMNADQPKGMEERSDRAFACWSWNSCEGRQTVVEIFAASDRAHFVKLYLNGHCVGRKDFVRKRTAFHLEYEPGTLAAVTYDGDGNKLGGRMLMTAVDPIHLSVKPEKKKVAAGEIVYVHICVQGSNTVVEANMDQSIRVAVEHGALLELGNSEKQEELHGTDGIACTRYGRALAVIRADGTGDILVKVESDDMNGQAIVEVEYHENRDR